MTTSTWPALPGPGPRTTPRRNEPGQGWPPIDQAAPSYRTGMSPEIGARSPLARALVDEATRKAGLVWLDYADAGGARPAWHVWHAGAAYVVTGPGEQHLPGLEAATTVEVTVPSKDTRARVVRWSADASRLRPGDDDWQPAVSALASSRLNGIDAPNTAQRWAATAVVMRLRPTGAVGESPGDMSDASHAAAPRDTSVTTLTRRPWMIGAKNRPPDASAH